MIKSKWFKALIITNTVALIDAIYLTYHHYKINILNPKESSFCSINSLLDCDKAAASAYAYFLGFPTSTLGVFAYAFLLLALIWGYKSSKTELKKFINFSFVVILVMFHFSLYEMIASFFVLKTLCIMCMILYLSIILMLVFAKLATPDKLSQIFSDFIYLIKFSLQNKYHAIGFSSVFIISIALAGISDEGYYRYFNYKSVLETRKADAEFLINQRKIIFNDFENLKVEKFDLSDSPFKGPKDAPITVIEFSDFQCPACASRAGLLSSLVNKYPNKVALYFKHYPLDNNCNPEIKRVFHLNACLAAYYAYCAQKQDRFWKMHDLIFEHRKEITDEILNGFVTKLSMNKSQFSNCISNIASDKVARDVRDANRVKVDYTPTIYLNGKKISDVAKTEEDFDYIIERLLEKQTKQ